MSVSFEDYQEAVLLVAVPTTEVPHECGEGLAEGSEFWVHTVGMSQYNRPEIEMVKVPGLWLRAAMQRINHWAHYSIDNEIKAGENIREGEGAFDPFLVVVGSPDETGFWARLSKGCLRITMGALMAECRCCKQQVN